MDYLTLLHLFKGRVEKNLRSRLYEGVFGRWNW